MTTSGDWKQVHTDEATKAIREPMLWCPRCHDGPFASGPCMNCGAAIETPQSPETNTEASCAQK